LHFIVDRVVRLFKVVQLENDNSLFFIFSRQGIYFCYLHIKLLKNEKKRNAAAARAIQRMDASVFFPTFYTLVV